MGYLGRAVRLEGISEAMTEEGSQLDQVATVCQITFYIPYLTIHHSAAQQTAVHLCQPAKDRKQPSGLIIFKATSCVHQHSEGRLLEYWKSQTCKVMADVQSSCAKSVSTERFLETLHVASRG
jgi:hypothetical protein